VANAREDSPMMTAHFSKVNVRRTAHGDREQVEEVRTDPPPRSASPRGEMRWSGLRRSGSPRRSSGGRGESRDGGRDLSGMVVLDAIPRHSGQARADDWRCAWNCKAGRVDRAARRLNACRASCA